MGNASSQEAHEFKPRKQSTSPERISQGRERRRRGFFSNPKSSPIAYNVVPAYHYSRHRHSHHQPVIVPTSPPPLPVAMPISHNHYSLYSHMLPYQPIMMLPLKFRHINEAPQTPLSHSISIPQFPPMMMPQQAPPAMFSPYISFYASGMPLSPPRVQQQPQAQPSYSNIGPSAPISMNIVDPTGQSPSLYQTGVVNVLTDWTAGGKISPGFLGPPL